MDLGLKGKVAMVSAASQGLGFAIAKVLADEGALVSIAARKQETIEAAAAKIGGNVLPFAADVTNREGIEAWHRATMDRFGGVDMLVTNSGGPPAGAASSFDDAAWQSAFELLLLSVVRTVRVVLPSMEARGGSILMLTSASVKNPIANLGLSNVVRASVSALAKTLADELAPKGIRVNQLVPGRIATERLAYLDEANAKKAGITYEQQRAKSMATIPMSRYGDPEEFAKAAVFLLSSASSYTTGATLQVDGGVIRSVV